LSSPPASYLATQILIRLRLMLWRLASAWGDSPAKNSWTTCRLNSIECVRCLAMGFLLESPGQLADSQVPYLSTPTRALTRASQREYDISRGIEAWRKGRTVADDSTGRSCKNWRKRVGVRGYVVSGIGVGRPGFRGHRDGVGDHAGRVRIDRAGERHAHILAG